jgi:predicted nucleic acid-binding protein
LTLARTPARIVTTSLVLLECGNAAARKPYRDQVPALWERLDAERRLIVPTSADIETAWADYRRGGAGDAGIVDHVSFTVMRRLGIRDAFTNDRHFAAAGFRTLF